MHARALVVLPTYNEAENVLALARAVLAVDPRLDVLVVDDASPDGTGDLVERERAQEPRLSLLRRAGKLGLGTAYLAGFRYGLDHGYGCVLTMAGTGRSVALSRNAMRSERPARSARRCTSRSDVPLDVAR